MAKAGKYSKIAGRHGREGFPQWEEDQKASKRRSIETGMKWVLVPVSGPGASDPDEGDDLITSEGGALTFRSDVAALRPHPAESWGYRVVPILTARQAAEGEKPGKRGPGRPRKRDVVGRTLVVGEPAIDAGASSMVRPPDGDTSIPEDQLTEDGDPFVELLDQAAAILSSYDYLDVKTVTRKVKEDMETRKEREKLNRSLPEEKKIQRKTETVVVTYVRERKPESEGAVTNLQRRTIDVSPGLSRAVQRMIEAGRVEEARRILDDLVVPLCAEFERVFPGSKVVGGGWHVRSGQLHLDLWVHGTWLDLVEAGIKEEPKAVRLWDPDILHHFGPGPGVCAWDRHVSALGGDAESYCPGIVAEVSKALADKQQRAAERDAGRRGAGQANRDVAIHRRFDEIVSAALPDEFVEIGMNEYREHLRGVYEGGDPKVLQAAADPEKFEKRKTFLENSMQELCRREAALEKKLARMGKESGELVANHVKQEEGRRWVGRKMKSRKLGRKIAALLAEASNTKNDAVRTINEAMVTEVHAEEMFKDADKVRKKLDSERKNLELKSDDLARQADLLRSSSDQVRAQASIDGLIEARRLLLGADVAEPPTMTAEQLGAVFRNEIVDHVDTKVIQKLDDARRRLAGDEVSISPAASLVEVEKGISDIFKIKEENAVATGTKSVFKLLNNGADPEGTTSAEIWKEITKSITKIVSQKLMGVFRRLRPNQDSAATTLEELEKDIAAGFDAFETRALESGLEEARKALVGSDAPALGNANEGTLRESIQAAAEQLKSKAKTEIAEAVIGKKLEKVIAEGKDPVELVELEFTRLKKVEAEAKMIAETAPQVSPNTPLGKALSKLRKLLKIDGPPDGKGGYGD